MTVSTAQQLAELLSAFLTGALLALTGLPFRALRRILPRLRPVCDIAFYTLAALVLFAAGQWCSGGIRLRFLAAAAIGAALCAGLLRTVRCSADRLLTRKRKSTEEEKEPPQKKVEKT